MLYRRMAAVDELPCDLDAHAVDAGVVDVVRLVEHNHAVARHFFAHDLGNLRVEQVVVRVDDNACLVYRPSKLIKLLSRGLRDTERH